MGGGEKKSAPFPNEIPEYFVRMQADTRKAMMRSSACGSLGWLLPCRTLCSCQTLRSEGQPCYLWNVWCGDGETISLEGTKHTSFLNSCRLTIPPTLSESSLLLRVLSPLRFSPAVSRWIWLFAFFTVIWFSFTSRVIKAHCAISSVTKIMAFISVTWEASQAKPRVKEWSCRKAALCSASVSLLFFARESRNRINNFKAIISLMSNFACRFFFL